jgi:hypothetical protein
MKKICLLLILLVSCICPSLSQTVLSAHKLELKKPWDSQQLLSATDPGSKQFFVFAADKEKVTVQKYNSAFFYRDSITMTRPERNYSFMAGYSFDQNANPTLYWASENFTKILSTSYNFNDHTTVPKAFAFSFDKETLLNSFTENGVFYILTLVDAEPKLILYAFKGDAPEQHILDFSSFTFENDRGEKIKLPELLEVWPFEKMESISQNTLRSVVAKSKLYMNSSKLVLTFDHNSKYTQLFDIDITSNEIREFKILQPKVRNIAGSNSFYSDGTIYQLRLNEEEMALSAVKVDDNDKSVLYKIGVNDTIDFKNSPLLLQIADQNPVELKTTRKFLHRLAGSNLGVSAYQAPGGLLLTVGGVRNYRSAGNIILGATLGLGMMAEGGSVDTIENVIGPGSVQSVFFESLFDEDFQHLDIEQQPLGTDFLSQFLADNDHISLYNLNGFAGHSVLAYYDPKLKQVILRKFSDGRQN